MDSMMGGGLALLGMTLRAINVGAADGSRNGEIQGVPMLTKFIEDKQETSRAAWRPASRSRGRDRPTHERHREEVHDFKGKDPKDQFIRGCYLEALLHRPVPGTSGGLVDMIDRDSDVEVRHQVRGPSGSAVSTTGSRSCSSRRWKTSRCATTPHSRSFSAARRSGHQGGAMYADYRKEALDELKESYYRSFGTGRTTTSTKVGSTSGSTRPRRSPASGQGHAQIGRGCVFRRSSTNLEFDNGPHSMTRVVLRYRLLEDAKKGDSAKKRGAIATLKFMKEQGASWPFARGRETGQLAGKRSSSS